MAMIRAAVACLVIVAAWAVTAPAEDLVSVSPNPATILIRPTDAPTCPPANTRGIYFDLSEGVLKAIDNACTTVSLEGAGAGGAPTNAQYWVGAADATLSAEKNLGVLATGLVVNTAGVPSIYAGSVCTTPQFSRGMLADTTALCEQPGFSEIAGTVSDSQVPNTITIDLATAATGLAANPTDCAANQFAQSIVASGNLTCAAIADADVPNNITITLAATATALAANGGNCGVGLAAAGVDASGTAEGCFAPSAAAHNLLSASHADTVASTSVAGDLIYGSGGGGSWEALAYGGDGRVLTGVGGIPSWENPTVYAPTTVEYIVAEASAALSAEVAPGAANQVPVSSSSTAAAWGTVPIAAGGTGQTTATLAFNALSPTTTGGDISYHNGTDDVRLAKGVAYQDLRMNSGATAPEWGSMNVILAAPVAVAVSASYVTVFTVQPIASKTNNIRFQIFHAASATTIGMQFRVLSSDAGNAGSCSFVHFGINATASSNVGTFTAVIAIGAAPSDTASLASFATAFNEVDINCAFTSDGTPGTVVLEAQLETGTTSANILAGSSYIYMFN